MGSSGSSRSSRTEPSWWTTVHERSAPVIAWCSTHRYLSLAGLALLGVLLGLAISKPSARDSLNDETDDDLAVLEEFEDFASEPRAEPPIKIARESSPHPATTAAFEDVTPVWGESSLPANRLMTATFEGSPPSVNAGPVWLAGTIETDDFSSSSDPLFLPQAEPVRDFSPPEVQATGPLLIPQ